MTGSVGVAAVYSATPDDIDIIKTWPGGNGMTVDQRERYFVPPEC